jgi:hypothetical protein
LKCGHSLCKDCILNGIFKKNCEEDMFIIRYHKSAKGSAIYKCLIPDCSAFIDYESMYKILGLDVFNAIC